jgi:hypothetical protein
MSNIISLSDLDKESKATNGDKETWKYLHGKATKEFVLEETTRIDADIEMIGEELKRSVVGFSQLFTLEKMLGLQLESVISVLDKINPDFRKMFVAEYKRTIAFSAFIDTLNNQGQHADKPILEKAALARDWNSNKENLKVKGLFFGLPDYIITHPTEFTEDQVEILALEFEFSESFEQYKTALAEANKPHLVPEDVKEDPVVDINNSLKEVAAPVESPE